MDEGDIMTVVKQERTKAMYSYSYSYVACMYSS